MTLTPLSNHLILSPVPPITMGLIHLPESSKLNPAEGIVVAVGPGKRSKSGQRIPLEVKVGDRVLCNRQMADPMRFDGKEYKVVSMNDVIAIL
jgi:chaperonin GroES